MKSTIKLTSLFAFIFFFGNFETVNAQTLKEFFSSSEISLTYLGIDFTKARLINDPGSNPMDIRNRIYGSINDVVVNEPKKYDFSGVFHKTIVSSDLTAVKENIQKINAEEINSSNSADFNRLKETDIANVVKALNLSGKKGIGFLFVMEGMKKVDKSGIASLWAVLVDMPSKKILLSERFESKAAGIGFRNYWASTIKITMDAIEKTKYKEWQSKYGQ